MKNVKREDNMSKRSLTTVLASAAIAAITASCLNVSVHAATKKPDSPAAVTDGCQLWNDYSIFFQHPPILKFNVAEAAKYEATASFDGKTLKLGRFPRHYIDLTRAWDKIPANSIVKVECTAIGVAKGSTNETHAARTFMKTAPFRAGSYPPPKEDYTRAALRIYDYVFDSPALKAFRETGKPDKSYKKNCYPSKMYSSLILMCERYAAARPERRHPVATAMSAPLPNFHLRAARYGLRSMSFRFISPMCDRKMRLPFQSGQNISEKVVSGSDCSSAPQKSAVSMSPSPA